MPFLSRARAKTARLLHNSLALGQWEIASLAARQIVADGDPAQTQTVLDVLRYITDHGPRPEW